MLNRHPLREGIIAGALGALAIAGWTLAVDAVTDRIGVTGALVGAWMYDALGGEFGGRGFTVHVVTWLVALFVGLQVVGIAASYLYYAADRRPSIVSRLVGLAVILEIMLLSVTGLASANPLFGSWAWGYGLVGNILAAVVMGRFLWRQRHPDNSWQWDQENERHFHQAPSGVKQ